MWNPRRFALNLILFSVSVWLVTVVIQMLFSIGSTAATSVIPAMLAAMQEGQKHAIATGHRPEASDIWRISRAMAEVYLGVTVVFCVILVVVSSDVRYVFAHINIGALFVIFGLFTGLALVFMRWGYSLGIRLGLQKSNKNTG